MATSTEAVIKNYADTVYKLAFSLVRTKSDAEDIFQEVFLRYVKKSTVFENEEHRKAWLLRVTINCAKKHWSSAWVRRTKPLDDNSIFSLPEETGLDDALRKLPQKYRSVIHLFYYERYSVEQISTILHVKQSTVRTQLTRARAQLHEMLKGEY
jgi:RNA polymerase sigma-70 factor (ECF subfamily)